jgi:hypothetical protein
VRLEQSAVQDNRMYGVVSQSGGKVALSECNVVRNHAVGVLVHRTGADCSIVGTDVSDNGEMGIAVQDGAQVPSAAPLARCCTHRADIPVVKLAVGCWVLELA